MMHVPESPRHIELEPGRILPEARYYWPDFLLDQIVTRLGVSAVSIEVSGDRGPRPSYAELRPMLELPADSAVVGFVSVNNEAFVVESLAKAYLRTVGEVLAYGSERTGDLPRCGPKTIAAIRRGLAAACPQIPWYHRPSAEQLATFCADLRQAPSFVLDPALHAIRQDRWMNVAEVTGGSFPASTVTDASVEKGQLRAQRFIERFQRAQQEMGLV